MYYRETAILLSFVLLNTSYGLLYGLFLHDDPYVQKCHPEDHITAYYKFINLVIIRVKII